MLPLKQGTVKAIKAYIAAITEDCKTLLDKSLKVHINIKQIIGVVSQIMNHLNA